MMHVQKNIKLLRGICGLRVFEDTILAFTWRV